MINEDKIKCLKCNTVRTNSNRNFYSNNNPLISSDKFLICKSCISEFIGVAGSDSYIDRVKLVLAQMNKPFLDDLWMQSNKEWSKYITIVSSLQKDKTFADSTLFINDMELNNYQESQMMLSDHEMTELALVWGKGYEVDEYMYLESEYNTLINRYDHSSYTQEMLFKQIAHKLLEIRRLREVGKSTDKEQKTLQDLLGSSNIKPVQETGANAAEQTSFGTLVKKWENDKPIPTPDPEWADVDGIKKYIQVWFLGHLCRMIGIKNEYSKMYEEEIAKYQVDVPSYEADE